MKAEHQKREMSSQEIEQHLKSAVDALAPDIFDRLDLSVPQQKPRPDDGQEKIVSLQRRMRGMAVAAAACLCLVTAGGGAWHYQYQNRQIDSVIGIDVNPSVELSISRKNRILKAEPLNADAESIMEDMDLKGVELNVAVNAVIGSMVTHGYLDDLDNAILVTVSNDSIKKATVLRSSVVKDIEQTLQENQVKAVVYDQQVIEEDAVRKLADTYGISYGKAYFLKELISQNENLTEADMGRLSTMNMEEIARTWVSSRTRQRVRRMRNQETRSVRKQYRKQRRAQRAAPGLKRKARIFQKRRRKAVPLRKALLKRKLLQSLRQSRKSVRAA